MTIVRASSRRSGTDLRAVFGTNVSGGGTFGPPPPENDELYPGQKLTKPEQFYVEQGWRNFVWQMENTGAFTFNAWDQNPKSLYHSMPDNALFTHKEADLMAKQILGLNKKTHKNKRWAAVLFYCLEKAKTANR